VRVCLLECSIHIYIFQYFRPRAHTHTRNTKHAVKLVPLSEVDLEAKNVTLLSPVCWQVCVCVVCVCVCVCVSRRRMSLISQIASEYVCVSVCARASAHAYEEGVGGRCDFEYANDRRLYVW
jgi:hypothetical protein